MAKLGGDKTYARLDAKSGASSVEREHNEQQGREDGTRGYEVDGVLARPDTGRNDADSATVSLNT